MGIGGMVIKIKIMMRIIGQKTRSTSQRTKLENIFSNWTPVLNSRLDTVRYLFTLSILIPPALFGVIFNDRR